MKLIDILRAERVHIAEIRKLNSVLLANNGSQYFLSRLGIEPHTSGDGMISLTCPGDYVHIDTARAALTLLVSELGGRCTWDGETAL
jgi:hypothetical protein